MKFLSALASVLKGVHPFEIVLATVLACALAVYIGGKLLG